MLGVATAATHIEGGYQAHNWYQWCEEGKIKDGSHCKVACDHINRIEEDVDLIAGLNCQTYRLGIEWSRIEPEEGRFSEEGVSIYRKELSILRERNIVPLVTLWHFSNPLWMEDDGGWVNPKSVGRYLRFATFVVDQLSDLVSDWITINEPNVYLFFAYFEGIWPPGKQGDIRSFVKAANHFCQAHLKAYQLIHQKQSGARVGVAHHLRVFDGLDDHWLTRKAIQLTAHVFQNMFLEAMTTGKFRFPLTRSNSKLEGDVYADFIGINYYSRDMVKGVFNPLALFGERSVMRGSQVNDLGWEIYPDGLYRLCTDIFKKYGLPIWITENGVCDSEDKLRSQFIYDHLLQLADLHKAGVEVERYYHWSLLDNFEWAEGNSARFGLYHTNYDTQVRTLRKSGKMYAEICQLKAVSNDVIDRYL